MSISPHSREPDPGSELEDEGVPDQSDALPGKVITGDAQEDMPPPAEQPVASTDFGITAAETREGESLDDRLSREVPDVAPADAGDDSPYPADQEERIGRFVEAREDETGKQQDSWAIDAGADTGGYTAEERAMHEDR